MKKILISLMTIAVVVGAATYGTIAYFNDTEEVAGNTITTGTIDISVDEENPWTINKQYSVEKMEPGDTKTMTETVVNVGTNPLVLWKKVTVTAREDNLQSEPECTDKLGTYVSGVCTYSSPSIDDLDSQLVYSQKLDTATNIDEAWDVRVSDLNDLWMPFGRVQPGATLVVDQNFHLDEMTGNAYQGDKLTFTVTYYAEQLDAPGPSSTANGVILENKNTAGEWEPLVTDGIWGILTWDGSGNYKAKGWGLLGANYRVAYYNETTSTETAISTPDTAVSSGTVVISGTYGGFGTAGAKYWLRDATYDNTNTLWESNLVN